MAMGSGNCGEPRGRCFGEGPINYVGRCSRQVWVFVFFFPC